MEKGYAWDLSGRSGALPDAGGKIVVHEFDYKAVNDVVYQKNGVTIRSWPAIHLERQVESLHPAADAKEGVAAS